MCEISDKNKLFLQLMNSSLTNSAVKNQAKKKISAFHGRFCFPF